MIKKILIIWAILFFFSVVALFVFTHETVHAVRLEGPQMMCLGLGESFGRVYHLDTSVQLKEEVIANIVAIIISLVYMLTTFYMILNFNKNNSTKKRRKK